MPGRAWVTRWSENFLPLPDRRLHAYITHAYIRGMGFRLRVATREDVGAIAALIDASVRGLQAGDYSAAQIEGALATVFTESLNDVFGNTSFQQLVGLLDAIVEPPYAGRADLPYLAEHEHVDDEQLFVLIEALQLLGFAKVDGADIWTTPVGRGFAEADLQERKRIFADQLLRTVPLAAHIRKVLDERPWHSAPEGRFLAELEDHLSEEEAREVLETVINWGRYAELFAYDYDRGVLSLENPS